jgi:hypothetical protein
MGIALNRMLHTQINTMRVAAFDMGTRNFAFCVEEYETLEDRPVKAQFDADGCATDVYQTYLDTQVYPRGRLVEMQCIDLKQYCESQSISNLYLGLTGVLNAYTRLWDAVDVFLIEQQMAYGHNKANIQALRLAQHTLSYFLTIYGPFRRIQEFPSTHKTRILGCPRTERRTHKSRKIFSVQLATRILSGRDDPLYPTLRTASKQDDVSDCVLMIQAHKALGG